MVAMDLSLIDDVSNLLATVCAGGLVIAGTFILFAMLTNKIADRSWWPF